MLHFRPRIYNFLLIKIVFFTGETKGRGKNSVPGPETLLRRIQMPEMQAKVDVGQFVVEYGPGVHQVPYQRLPAQTAAAGEARRSGRVRSVESASAASLPKVQGVGILLQTSAIIVHCLFLFIIRSIFIIIFESFFFFWYLKHTYFLLIYILRFFRSFTFSFLLFKHFILFDI